MRSTALHLTHGWRCYVATIGCALAIGCSGDDELPQPRDAGAKDAGAAGASSDRAGAGTGAGGHAGSRSSSASSPGGTSGASGVGGTSADDLDAGVGSDAAAPIEPTGTLRSVSVHMTGMSDEVGHFMQLRLIAN